MNGIPTPGEKTYGDNKAGLRIRGEKRDGERTVGPSSVNP